MKPISLSITSAERPLTLSLARWLVCIKHQDQDWLDPRELMSLKQALVSSGFPDADETMTECYRDMTSEGPPLPRASHSTERKDPRTLSNAAAPLSQPSASIKVYTDWPAILEMKDSLTPRITLVNSKEDAHFLFLTENVTNFLNIPPHQRVNQFPYEGGFCRKDLLPLAIRGYCFSNNASSENGGKATPPDWYLPCWDLSTEFHLFAKDYLTRHYQSNKAGEVSDSESESSNDWIIKPAQGTRGMGHKIVQSVYKTHAREDAGERGRERGRERENEYAWMERGRQRLRDIAQCAPQLKCLVEDTVNDNSDTNSNASSHDRLKGMDRVAQLLVDKPLLVKLANEAGELDSYKFDLRVYVVVRSFVPLEIYLHCDYYARIANKPYDTSNITDEEVCLTVSAYSDDAVRASKQRRLSRHQLEEILHRHNESTFTTNRLSDQIEHLVYDLFSKVAPSVGHWPNSSAYYAVDIIFDDTYSAKLIEVNFMGDITGYRHVCASDEASALFVKELIELMATTGPPQLTSHDWKMLSK